MQHSTQLGSVALNAILSDHSPEREDRSQGLDLADSTPKTVLGLSNRSPGLAPVTRLLDDQIVLGRSAGFTFIEIIVGLAIVLMVATVVTPVLLGRLDAARIETSMKSVDSIRTGITDFEADVGHYPGELSQLATAVSTAMDNVCDDNFSNSEVSRWDGPYLDRLVPSTGLRIPIGRIRNQLDELPNNSSNPSLIRMTVDSVAIEDAEELNVLIDGDVGNSTQHNVQWTTPATAEGLVTLSLIGPIGGC